MPTAWRCPGCRTIIEHNESEEEPRSGARYRCHVCRMDLLFDPSTQRLAVPPLDGEHDGEDNGLSRLPKYARPLIAPVNIKRRRRAKTG